MAAMSSRSPTRLCLRLQQLQSARRRPALLDDLYRPGRLGRPADGSGARGYRGVAAPASTICRHQPEGRARGRIPRPFAHRQGHPSAGVSRRPRTILFGGESWKTLPTRPGDPRAIEIASRDEIAAAAARADEMVARHAYENSAFYRTRFDDAGVHPDDLKSLADLAKFPFTAKQDLRDTYPVRHVRRAARKARAASMAPRERPASRRSSATRRTTSTPGPTWSPARSGPPAAGRATSCMSPMATASLPAASARITAPRGSAAPWCRSPAA